MEEKVFWICNFTNFIPLPKTLMTIIATGGSFQCLRLSSAPLFFFSKLMSLSFNYSSSIKMTESEDIFWAVPGMFPQTRFRAVVLHPGQFAHIIWQHLQTFLVVTTGLWGGSYWYQWAESRDIAEHPTVYRTASHNKGLGSPTCH